MSRISLFFYRIIIAGAGFVFLLKHRDRRRLGERRGRATHPRPKGGCVWIHAASVGETLATLPLVAAILRDHPDVSVLMTTHTEESAGLVARHEAHGARLIHQYAPLDTPASVRRFLDHWRPHAMLIVEADLWPTMLLEARARAIPLALVNARCSLKSLRRFRRIPATARHLFGGFDIILAQDEIQAERLAALGGAHIHIAGNLKFDAPALPVDASALTEWQPLIATRPHWLAASTHAPEEEFVADCHATLARRHEKLLTFIAPRHPARGDAVAALFEKRGLAVARRSAGATPDDTTDIYLIDTIGDMGLFYRLNDIAFLGGSFAPRGGHNPLEPARLDCALIYGPHMENFPTIAAALGAAQAAVCVADADALTEAVDGLLADPERARALSGRAAEAAGQYEGVVAQYLAHLAPLLRERENA